MKTNAPPIPYDPEWLREIDAENKRPKGIGLYPGTIVTTDSEDTRYIVAPGGTLRKITATPSATVPGKFDVALERKPGNEFMSARQRRKFIKNMRRRACTS